MTASKPGVGILAETNRLAYSHWSDGARDASQPDKNNTGFYTSVLTSFVHWQLSKRDCRA